MDILKGSTNLSTWNDTAALEKHDEKCTTLDGNYIDNNIAFFSSTIRIVFTPLSYLIKSLIAMYCLFALCI